MNSQWTAQDVERFREQQRWRLRQKAHHHTHSISGGTASHAQAAAMYRRSQSMPTNTSDTDSSDRVRKVSLKFRREHQQFLSKQSLPPHLSALAITLRPTFAVPKQRPSVESPLPHTDRLMFNAFDSIASPEAFSLSNQDEEDDPTNSWKTNNNRRKLSVTTDDEDEDMATMSDGDDDSGRSLWRRRFHVHGMARLSPKLGQGALWDAGEPTMPYSNQLMEMRRVPLPFASDDYDHRL